MHIQICDVATLACIYGIDMPLLGFQECGGRFDTEVEFLFVISRIIVDAQLPEHRDSILKIGKIQLRAQCGGNGQKRFLGRRFTSLFGVVHFPVPVGTRIWPFLCQPWLILERIATPQLFGVEKYILSHLSSGSMVGG
ncbi:MAG: hypothetical protein PHR30_05930 [Gallionellaceae bacterium]|nr:hypothetical protein [Gallionellaceae bacterium]